MSPRGTNWTWSKVSQDSFNSRVALIAELILLSSILISFAFLRGHFKFLYTLHQFYVCCIRPRTPIWLLVIIQSITQPVPYQSLLVGTTPVFVAENTSWANLFLYLNNCKLILYNSILLCTHILLKDLVPFFQKQI
jgi:hypothetical protein